MGRGDNRLTLKTKKRRAQRKKKANLKKLLAERPVSKK